MKKALVALLLGFTVSFVAVAGNPHPAKCKRDQARFEQDCEKACNRNLKKKSPAAAEACKKSCRIHNEKHSKDCDP
jgi:hypothetical protein